MQKDGTMVQSGGACKVVRRSPGPDPGCSAREGAAPSPGEARLTPGSDPKVESGGGGEEERRGGYEAIRRSW